MLWGFSTWGLIGGGNRVACDNVPIRIPEWGWQYMIGWLNDINRLVSKDKREPRVIPAENTHTLSPPSIRKVNAQPARVESSARETIGFSFSCSKKKKMMACYVSWNIANRCRSYSAGNLWGGGVCIRLVEDASVATCGEPSWWVKVLLIVCWRCLLLWWPPSYWLAFTSDVSKPLNLWPHRSSWTWATVRCILEIGATLSPPVEIAPKVKAFHSWDIYTVASHRESGFITSLFFSLRTVWRSCSCFTTFSATAYFEELLLFALLIHQNKHRLKKHFHNRKSPHLQC